MSQVCTTPLYTICTRFDWIMCQVVTYQRLYTIEKSKLSTQKVAAYQRWSPMRGSNYSDLTLTSQVEVRCPRGPGAAIAITTPRRQNTRLAYPNRQPSHEPPASGPRTRAPVTLTPKWLSGRELYTRTQINGPVTGEEGKGTLRKLLHTKQRHADRTTNNKRKHIGWLRMYQTETPLDGIRPQHSSNHMATNATNIRQTLNATNKRQNAKRLKHATDKALAPCC